MKCRNHLFVLLIILLPIIHLNAQDPPFEVETIVQNLERPWSLDFLPDHRPDEPRLLLTERTGRLLLLEGKRLREVQGAPEVAVVGQGGLLDVILSPTFGEDSLVFISFSESGSGGYGTSVARGYLNRRENAAPRLENVAVIYRALPRSSGGRHFGSRLAFDKEGYLYVTLGERGNMQRARDTHDPYGSVLRLNPDGSIPTDNPFASAGIRPGEGAEEIWTYGHRNSQGMAVHPESGDIWLHEHGPKGGDEINILRKGADYGWPLLTWGIDYDGTIISDRQTAPGYEDSILHWIPSIAPSGMAFYSGEAFPDWQGDLFVGALAGQHLRRIDLQDGVVVDQEVLLQGQLGRIRDVESGPDGFIYLLTDSETGGLFRLKAR